MFLSFQPQLLCYDLLNWLPRHDWLQEVLRQHFEVADPHLRNLCNTIKRTNTCMFGWWVHCDFSKNYTLKIQRMKVQQYIHRVDNNADNNSTKRQIVHPINLQSIISTRDVSKLKLWLIISRNFSVEVPVRPSHGKRKCELRQTTCLMSEETDLAW